MLEALTIIQQGTRFKPAGLQGRDVANGRHRTVRTQHDLKAVIQREAIPARRALAAAHNGCRLDEHILPTNPAQLQSTRQPGKPASHNGNHAASLIHPPLKRKRFALRWPVWIFRTACLADRIAEQRLHIAAEPE